MVLMYILLLWSIRKSQGMLWRHIFIILCQSLLNRHLGTSLLCLLFHLLCYAAVLKNLTYYAHVKDLCLNLTVLLEYIKNGVFVWCMFY